MSNKDVKMSVADLQALIEQLTASNAKLAEENIALAAKKSSRTSTASKVLIHELVRIQNADYIGAFVTLYTLEEILAYKAKLEDIAAHTVYIKVSGRVLIDGKKETLKSLTAVDYDATLSALVLHDTTQVVTSATDEKTFDKVRIVSMRPSAVERYFINNGKVAKTDSEEDVIVDSEEDAETDDITVDTTLDVATTDEEMAVA
jgi:hypothetical protein